MPPKRATTAAASGATPRRSARGASSTPAPSDRALPARSLRASPARGARASPARGARRAASVASGADEPEDVRTKGSSTYGSKGAAAAGQKAIASGTSLEDALEDTIIEEGEPEEEAPAPSKRGPGRPSRASPSPAKSPARKRGARGAAAAAEDPDQPDEESDQTPPRSPRQQPDILANRPDLRPAGRRDSDEEEEEGEETTDLQNRASYQVPAYVADRAAGRIRRLPDRQQPARRPQAAASSQPNPRAQPPRRVQAAREPRVQGEYAGGSVRSILDFFDRIGSILTLLLVSSVIFILFNLALCVPPVKDYEVAQAYRNHVRGLFEPITSRVNWASVSHPAGANGDVLRRLTAVERRLDDMASRGELLDGSLTKLKEWLPSGTVVNRQGNDEYRIPYGFWNALKEKLDSDPKPSQKWDKWLRQNEANLNSYVSSKVKNDLDTRRLVTPDDFLDLLKKNYAALAPSINADLNARIAALHTRLDTLHADVSSTAISAAQSALSTALDQLPTTQLKSLTAINIAKNTDTALKSVNYLACYLNPVIDPALTSPTSPHDTTKSFRHRSWSNLFGTVAPGPNDHEAFAALTPWNEAGDCWCAAPPPPVGQAHRKAERTRKSKPVSPGPKAQLAVVLGQPVVPSGVTIEHVPRQGTVDKSSAPKDMELWAEMDSMASYGLAWGEYEKIHGERTAIPREQTAAEGLPGLYVKIAEWRYEWGGEMNWVQSQPVQMDLGRLGLATRKIVVRASSNYGGKQTCFYRVRLHGSMRE